MIKLNEQKVVFDWKRRNSLKALCFSMIFVLSLLLSGFNTAYAATSSNWQIIALAPFDQEMKLSTPSAAAPGGRGFMTPQKVCILNSNGGPVINTPVTFEVSSNVLITSLMRGTYSRSITVYTDSNGIATAANTHADFLGEGFQVYSQYAGIKQTLQVTASVPGLNKVTFNVVVKTYGYQY
ncbi:Ig-like domain-containing protein [Ruminiclostridium herbifermentans]|uniref:Ig-like domain-containing protein n=1 Tax=Ruminiclostridium herbifermentans TaxID=2488810 RepID=A0A4U7J746_9FIRM|nr:Ig-like domain-containing protein [Ruminiclostridium herbifermentans]QNU66953.1 Ig-like domain-containing protein [Ruminiclostridium herbifermentans]